jgi:predicted metal-dependent hydrolase
MVQGKEKGSESQHFYNKCSELLYNYWREIQAVEIEKDYIPELRENIAALMRTGDKSYRYVLPTQLIAIVSYSRKSPCWRWSIRSY